MVAVGSEVTSLTELGMKRNTSSGDSNVQVHASGACSPTRGLCLRLPPQRKPMIRGKRSGKAAKAAQPPQAVGNTAKVEALNPFDNCPDEILSEIFYIAVGQISTAEQAKQIYDRKPQPSIAFTLSHVCARWHSVAVATPVLWADISIHDWLFPMMPVFKQDEGSLVDPNRMLCEFVETCLARSADHPLYISWRFCSNIRPSPKFLATFAKTSHRWRELYLSFWHVTTPLETVLQDKHFGGLPNLRKLWVSEGISQLPTSELPVALRAIKAPKLEFVNCHTTSGVPNAIIGQFSLVNATYLHISFEPANNLPLLASMVNNTPHLRYLHISLENSWSRSIRLPSDITLDLQNLSRLSITSNPRCSWHFLSRIRAPTLTHLHISEDAEGYGWDDSEGDATFDTDVDRFLDSVPRNLEVVTVQCMPSTRFQKLLGATRPKKINLTDMVLGCQESGEGVDVHGFMENVVSRAGNCSQIEELAIFNQVREYEGSDDGFAEQILSTIHQTSQKLQPPADPRPLRIKIYSDMPMSRKAIRRFDPRSLPEGIVVQLYMNWESVPRAKWRGFGCSSEDETEDLAQYFTV
ncbi:hypothetical protein DFP72DRAFT_1120326 [Ephemerocybe angulata]|uniref:F-box domain-containing protein n=1 Tax=Ephemerocybe angulata TaxID=980116 RepID=A0A8H6IIA6_9AGAR|nr:hypothetical protein DFP72DRAFT_1120326 [Tulosesus angulatus]